MLSTIDYDKKHSASQLHRDVLTMYKVYTLFYLFNKSSYSVRYTCIIQMSSVECWCVVRTLKEQQTTITLSGHFQEWWYKLSLITKEIHGIKHKSPGVRYQNYHTNRIHACDDTKCTYIMQSQAIQMHEASTGVPINILPTNDAYMLHQLHDVISGNVLGW